MDTIHYFVGSRRMQCEDSEEAGVAEHPLRFGVFLQILYLNLETQIHTSRDESCENDHSSAIYLCIERVKSGNRNTEIRSKCDMQVLKGETTSKDASCFHMLLPAHVRYTH